MRMSGIMPSMPVASAAEPVFAVRLSLLIHRYYTRRRAK
jgi:hypothetical protein